MRSAGHCGDLNRGRRLTVMSTGFPKEAQTSHQSPKPGYCENDHAGFCEPGAGAGVRRRIAGELPIRLRHGCEKPGENKAEADHRQNDLESARDPTAGHQ